MMDSQLRSIISRVVQVVFWTKRHKFLEELTREWLTELVILNVCFVCLFVRVLHANVMQSIMSHFSASPPSTNGPLLTDTYEFGNVISFSHNFAAATFCHFQLSHSFAKSHYHYRARMCVCWTTLLLLLRVIICRLFWEEKLEFITSLAFTRLHSWWNVKRFQYQMQLTWIWNQNQSAQLKRWERMQRLTFLSDGENKTPVWTKAQEYV